VILQGYYGTKQEARRANETNEQCRFHGTAKHIKGYIAWRTDCKRCSSNILTRQGIYDLYTDVELD